MYSLFTKDYTEEFCSDRNIDNLRQLINVSVRVLQKKHRTDKVNVCVCACICENVCMYVCACMRV